MTLHLLHIQCQDLDWLVSCPWRTGCSDSEIKLPDSFIVTCLLLGWCGHWLVLPTKYTPYVPKFPWETSVLPLYAYSGWLHHSGKNSVSSQNHDSLRSAAVHYHRPCLLAALPQGVHMSSSKLLWLPAPVTWERKSITTRNWVWIMMTTAQRLGGGDTGPAVTCPNLWVSPPSFFT